MGFDKENKASFHAENFLVDNGLNATVVDLYAPASNVCFNYRFQMYLRFLSSQVRKEYYEQHPFLISTLPNVTREIIRAIYQPYDASPTALKKRTDSSRTLSKQLNNLKITKSKLKIRERRILAQTKYLLQHNFDFPLEDYYSGIWLLGPDYLCESTTCDILTHFRGVLIRFLPRTVEDLELVKHWILKHNSTFNQLEENGRSGVKYGMVQPMEVCRASVDALKSYNSGIGDKGPEGVWDEPIGNIVLSEDFYEDLEDDVVTKWQAKYDNQYPSETLKKALLDGIGKPFQKYLNYLKGEHLKHCVPSTVSSGLSKLPLKNVYTDGRINEE